MADLQLFRDTTGSLPYLSHWAREEPAIKKKQAGNTDHWAKMKHKTTTFTVHDRAGRLLSFHGDRMRHEGPVDRSAEEKLIQIKHDIDGNLTRVGGPSFTDLIIRELHGHLPGDYTKLRPLPPKLLRTAANARAREGYQYWYQEKPPSKGGKYTYGAKDTFLGLGKKQ